MKTFTPDILPNERVALKNHRATAEDKGYSIIRDEVLSSPSRKKDLAAFLKLIEKMPADLGDKLNTRRRFVTYAHFYKPNEDTDTLLYFTEPKYDLGVGANLFIYHLSKKFNPENSEPRKFAPLPEEALKHRFLQHMIEAGFHAAPVSSIFRYLPMEVEVQFIRYEPRRDTESFGTPPTTHQDNDWAFCVFLLEWENVEGPINAFVSVDHVNKSLDDVPASERAMVFLTKLLEGYCVEDTKVAHYVGPVGLKQGAEYGRRTIIILSYKPLVPLRPADINKAAEFLKDQPDLLGRISHSPDEIEFLVSDLPESSRKQFVTMPNERKETIRFRRGLY